MHSRRLADMSYSLVDKVAIISAVRAINTSRLEERVVEAKIQREKIQSMREEGVQEREREIADCFHNISLIILSWHLLYGQNNINLHYSIFHIQGATLWRGKKLVVTRITGGHI